MTHRPWSDKQHGMMLIGMKNTKDITARFGQRVKTLRLQAGLSQEAFADKCGLDRTYISGIERGVRNPTLEVIGVIADGLEIQLQSLFDF
ncbi:MunI regulatory protein [Dickeya dadantii 3937]|uniref:MunI regulatory protein n=5 Tax=Dickeya TaxID=204037 RepID=E0SAK3_DICD3|nr:MunI regulatory protein [Dickeya dadantii 3937]